MLTVLVASTLAAISLWADEPAQQLTRTEITVGEYRHIYDPSVGEKEKWYINDHCFIQDDRGMWHLFGITHQEPQAPLDEIMFAHATARTLAKVPWQKQPPALRVAREAPWEERHLWAPHVVKHDDLYYMFYCAGGETHSTYRLHVATSPDLENWTRRPENPLVVDGFDARDPCVFRHSDKWIMYYTATRPKEEGNHVVVAVSSLDLLNWSNPMVVFTHPSIGKWGGPTESPFVFKRNDRYYLGMCDMPPYDKTTFYVSESPYHWDIGSVVGTTAAHCAEVIHTDDDRWYVSRAGWGRHGVYIAPLEWSD